MADNTEGLKKTPEEIEAATQAAKDNTSKPVDGVFRPAGSKVVDIDPARAPMQDERKELAHSTIVEGEREELAADLKKRAAMHAEANSK